MRKAFTIDDYELDFRDSETLKSRITKRLEDIDKKKETDEKDSVTNYENDI